jgi:phosphoribosylanthranilate isomerase
MRRASEPLFRIKICGVTSGEDAALACAAGAEAIGLNFYARSTSAINERTAAEIVQSIPANVAKVGVFVNDEPERIVNLHRTLPLDYVQLHGDESPEFVASLTGIPIIKAWRLGPDDAPGIVEFVTGCAARGAPLAALLIDAAVAGSYGGTGKTADWSSVAALRNVLPPALPLILAGGLTAENVAAAIASAQPDAVDTASGVESSPGKKDLQRTADFIQSARSAFSL